jgi:hypothetical protein
MLAALVAVFALGALGSASASAALPEFVPGTGEKLPATLEGSLSSAESSFKNETGVRAFGCTGAKFKGEVTGAKAASLTLELEGCRTEASSTCHSAGAAEGHVVVSGAAALDYISKATKRVGLVLKLNEVEVSCGGVEYALIRGSVVVPVTPINTKTSKVDLVIKTVSGKQEVSSYENEKGEVKTVKLEMAIPAWENVTFEVGQEIKLASSKPLTIDA